MIHHRISYFLFGIGLCGLLFSLGRTYYLFWKLKKERERGRYRPGLSPKRDGAKET